MFREPSCTARKLNYRNAAPTRRSKDPTAVMLSPSRTIQAERIFCPSRNPVLARDSATSILQHFRHQPLLASKIRDRRECDRARDLTLRQSDNRNQANLAPFRDESFLFPFSARARIRGRRHEELQILLQGRAMPPTRDQDQEFLQSRLQRSSLRTVELNVGSSWKRVG